MENETNDITIKDIRNVFRPKKESKAIKNRVFRNLFVHEDENYYKPVRTDHFWSNNHIEYESNGDKSKTVSITEYLN